MGQWLLDARGGSVRIGSRAAPRQPLPLRGATGERGRSRRRSARLALGSCGSGVAAEPDIRDGDPVLSVDFQSAWFPFALSKRSAPGSRSQRLPREGLLLAFELPSVRPRGGLVLRIRLVRMDSACSMIARLLLWGLASCWGVAARRCGWDGSSTRVERFAFRPGPSAALVLGASERGPTPMARPTFCRDVVPRLPSLSR